MIKRIAFNFKGHHKVVDLTKPNLLVTGRNGAGKSRIGEAVAFALGRDVLGVPPNSMELKSVIGSGETGLSASIVVEDDQGLVSITRSRTVSPKGEFKRAVATGERKGGDAIDAEAYIASRFAFDGRGLRWLTATGNELLSTFVRLGSESDAAASSTMGGVKKAADAATEARTNLIRANAVVESTKADLGKIPKPAKPLPELEAALKEAGTAERAALAALRETPPAQDARLVAIVQKRAKLPETIPAVPPNVIDAAVAAHDAAKSVLDAAELAAGEAFDAIGRARAAATEATEARRALAGSVDTLLASYKVLAKGCCPTCKQTPTADVVASAKAVLEAAQADLDRKIVSEKLAGDTLTEAVAAHEAAKRELGAAAKRVDEAAQEVAAKRKEASYVQEILALEHEWVELGLDLPIAATSIPVDETPILAARKAHEQASKARQAAQNAVDAAKAYATAEQRHTAAVAAAAAAQKASDAAHQTKRDVDAALDGARERGKQMLCEAAQNYVPADIGEVVLVGDSFGLRLPNGEEVAQRGLSAAQQLLLCVGLDLGVASFAPFDEAKWQVLHVEADALDEKTLPAFLTQVQNAATLVIVTTCHAPVAVGPQWQHLAM